MIKKRDRRPKPNTRPSRRPLFAKTCSLPVPPNDPPHLRPDRKLRPARLRCLIGFLLLCLAGPAVAQTSIDAAVPAVTSTGDYNVQLYYTVAARDSLIVTKYRDGYGETGVAKYASSTVSMSYSRRVTIGKTVLGQYTFIARRYAGTKMDSAFVRVWVGPVITGDPDPLPILQADTSRSTRIVGDTTFTTTMIVALRGRYDTTSSTSFVVAPPPPPPNPYQIDSVKLSTPAIPSWDTTKTKVSLNYYIYPHPTSMQYTVRWFINDSLVKTSTQVQLTTAGGSTIQFVNTNYASMKFVACARMSPDTQAHERCSSPVTWTAPISTVPPSVDTTKGFTVLALGPVVNAYTWNGLQWVRGTDSLRLPIWTHPRVTGDTGQRLFFTSDSGKSWVQLPVRDSQVVAIPRPVPGGVLQFGLQGFTWDPHIRAYWWLMLGPVPEIPGTKYYAYTEPVQ